jgi:hypothetical protein
VADITDTDVDERLYNYVRYKSDDMEFTTHAVFDGIVEEILTNKSFAILYSRDRDKNIRDLVNYSMRNKCEFELVKEEAVSCHVDMYDWESLYVSTFSETALAV